MNNIPCLCIDADDKPNEIPNSKWLVEGEIYHVIYTSVVLPQHEIGFHLAEIELTENELPYEYFLSYRFAFQEEDLSELDELIQNCNEADSNVRELMKEITL